MQIAKTHLQFTSFSGLINWSVQYMLDTRFSYADKYKLVEIGAFLKRNKSAIDIEDNKEYKRVTIKINNGGVFLRDIQKGTNIGTKKQFIISEGQFLLSKIDARNGAFGVVSKELDGAIVTNDFPAFDVDVTKILPQYLLLITTTTMFVKFAQSCSSGTTNRQRMDIEQFLSQKIPLPSLEEQNRIVKNYTDNIRQAEILERKADDLEKEIEEYLFDTLGIERKDKKHEKKGKLYFVQSKELSRWDTDFFLKEKKQIKSSFLTVKYADVFTSLKNGVAARNYTSKEYGVRYLKVSDIKNNGISNKNISYVSGTNDSDLLKENILLITRKGTVGQSYFIKESINAVASSEVFIITLKSVVLGDYLSIINLSSFVKEQYMEKCTGTIMPSLSQEQLKTIQIPLPPLFIQEEISGYIQNMNDKILTLRQNAEGNRKRAIKEFEQKLFK